MIDLVTVSISTAYPDLGHIGDVTINPRTVACSYETQAGGWGRASVGLLPADAGRRGGAYAFLPEPVEAPENAHVTFKLGGAVVYEGVIVTVAPNRLGFECEGYGIWAPQWGTVDAGGDGMVTSGVMVREAIRAVPWLSVGEITDPGVRHAWDEIQYQKSGAIIDQMATEGDGETPWMFTVYEDRLAHFTPKIPADAPDLVLSYDPDTMEVGWQYDRLDAVRILYTDANNVERPSSWFYRPGVDRTSAYLRRETLSGSGTSTGAIAIAQTHLATRSNVSLSGSATFTDWQHLFVRYGNTFEMLGYGYGVIEGTSTDLFSGTTQITLGVPYRWSPRGFFQRLAQTEMAVRTGRDVVTRTKLRNREV